VPATSSPYSWLLLLGVGTTLWWWSRLARRDERLLIIYVAALVSAFLGAKLVYLAAEGWMFWNSPDRWLIWATGKSILGALLGGYAGVELAKKATGYHQATGDWFALVAPVGIIFGRIGCLLHGCCLGQECRPHWWTLRDVHGAERWPAVPVEIGFNLAALGAFLFLRRKSVGLRESYETTDSANLHVGASLRGQHFHLYLIGYGLFRFGHEVLRATPRIGTAFTGYQLASLAVAGLGVWGFLRRRADARCGSCGRPETSAAIPG
jgi:phosphatidylglycerol:prolipoprotein diacylglycerol transferase